MKKRVTLPVKENFAEYDQKLKQMLAEMRDCLKKGKIPEIPKGQKCGGCSMRDLCMPSVKKRKAFRAELEEIGKMEV